MIRVGWLVDRAAHPGGAELTQAEFRDDAPAGVEIVECPAGGIDDTCDRYVIQNCVQYTPDELRQLEGRPTVKYWHDVAPWLHPDCREWLARNATQVCCSPIQAEYMGLNGVACIPPPVRLDRFAEAAAESNGNRRGVVSVGSWRNHGKAPHKVAEWANGEGFQMVPGGRVDFYGGGPFAPRGAQEVPYEGMPSLLARYETFVFLPIVIEPFGRVVAEAWAAGCRLVINGLVGAGYWIEQQPDAIETAAGDFWKLVLA